MVSKAISKLKTVPRVENILGNWPHGDKSKQEIKELCIFVTSFFFPPSLHALGEISHGRRKVIDQECCICSS